MGEFVAAEKLKQLRDWMQAEKLDAYLVPHSDRFQSEYLPPEDERLAWLTGFTGSNGQAAILLEKAVLFTDSRYTLQALAQVDTTLYDVVETPPAKMSDWLGEHLAEGAVVGVDPWLWTAAQIAQLKKTAEQKKWTVRGIDGNPIDRLWTDRKASAPEKAMIYPLSFAGEDTQAKIVRLVTQMSPKAERILLSEPGLVCWLLNVRGKDVAHVPVLQSLAVLDRDGAVTMLADKRKIGDDVRQSLGNRVAIEELSALEQVLAANKKPLQLDPAQAPLAVKDLLAKHEITVIEAIDPSIMLRACKNKTEIDGAIEAHRKDGVAFRKFLNWYAQRDFAHEVITELDMVDKLRDFRAEDPDFLDTSFDTIAGYGSNGAIVHYHADAVSNQRLLPGNLFLLDSGGQYLCGTTDITRTLAVGTPSPQMKKHAQAVYDGMKALSHVRFPVGTVGFQLEALARGFLWQQGIDFGHSVGHCIGAYLSVHEDPRPWGRDLVELKPGMITSIEPGYYRAGEYGIRFENLVVVVEDFRPEDEKKMLAFKTLTDVPFDETLINL